MHDVLRLPSGKGPLVTLRQTQLQALGLLDLHAEWAKHVQTAEYQELWDAHRRHENQPEVQHMDTDDRLQRLRRAHNHGPSKRTRQPKLSQPLGKTGTSTSERLDPGRTTVHQPTRPSSAEAIQDQHQYQSEETTARKDSTQATVAHPATKRPVDDHDMDSHQPESARTPSMKAVQPAKPGPEGDHDMAVARPTAGRKPIAKVGIVGRGMGMKVASRKAPTKKTKATTPKRPIRGGHLMIAATAASPAKRTPDLLDLTSSPDDPMDHGAQAKGGPSLPTTEQAASGVQDPERPVAPPQTGAAQATSASTLRLEGSALAPQPAADATLTPVRQALRELRGRAPAYEAGTYTASEGHPHIKHLLNDMLARLSPTPANGNCISSALLEAEINRPLRSLTETERAIVAEAMRELKNDIFEALDRDGEYEAAHMHHGEAVSWMEATGGMREEAHHRYFVRLRDSDCHYHASVPVAAWGGIEALCMTAKARGTPIYLVIEHAETGDCCLMKIMRFRPGTSTETWQPLQLPYEAWWQHLSREATAGPHYSALLIDGPPPSTVQATIRDFYPTTAAQDGQPGEVNCASTTTAAVQQPSASAEAEDRNQLKPEGGDDVSTSQDETRPDNNQSATSHHDLLLQERTRCAASERQDEVTAFQGDPDLTPMTVTQQEQLDRIMGQVTDQDVSDYGRTSGDMSMARARHEIWLRRRQEITGLAQPTRQGASDQSDESDYQPSGADDQPDSDDSMETASDAVSDDFEPDAVLVDAVTRHFGKLTNASMEQHLRNPATIAKLEGDIAEWTAFFATIPRATDYLRELPEKFVRRWCMRAIAELRIGLLRSPILTLTAGLQRQVLQRWLAVITREQNPRHAQRHLNSPAKQQLLLTMIPAANRDWVKYIYND